MPKLHILPPLHVEQKEENFICAFTGKAVRFAEMMTNEGWECVFYHNGDTDVTCCETVQLLTHDEYWRERRKIEKDDNAYFSQPLLDYSSSLHNKSLSLLWNKANEHYEKGDIFCHTFGSGCERVREIEGSFHVETGIGYGFPWAPYRIYETYAWMSYLSGRDSSYHPSNYNFVIPNYYRTEDWNRAEHENYVLWGNRLQEDKGLWTLRDIAKEMSSTPFVVAGHGILPKEIRKLSNVFFVGPLSLEKRKEVWSKALCTLMPTQYFEPFGGFHVEGMMCGVPAVTSDFGCFSETVIPNVNGYRCKTIGDWVGAIELADSLDRDEIQRIAVSKYSMEAVGPQYTAAFNQILELNGEGWYSKKSHYLNTQLSEKTFLLDETP